MLCLMLFLEYDFLWWGNKWQRHVSLAKRLPDPLTLLSLYTDTNTNNWLFTFVTKMTNLEMTYGVNNKITQAERKPYRWNIYVHHVYNVIYQIICSTSHFTLDFGTSLSIYHTSRTSHPYVHIGNKIRQSIVVCELNTSFPTFSNLT